MNKLTKALMAAGLSTLFLSACGDSDQYEEDAPQDEIIEENEDVKEEQEDVNEEQEDVEQEQQEADEGAADE